MSEIKSTQCLLVFLFLFLVIATKNNCFVLVQAYTSASHIQKYEIKACNNTSSFYFAFRLRLTVSFSGYLGMVTRRMKLFCCAASVLTKHGFKGFVRQEIVLDSQCLTDLKLIEFYVQSSDKLFYQL